MATNTNWGGGGAADTNWGGGGDAAADTNWGGGNSTADTNWGSGNATATATADTNWGGDGGAAASEKAPSGGAAAGDAWGMDDMAKALPADDNGDKADKQGENNQANNGDEAKSDAPEFEPITSWKESALGKGGEDDEAGQWATSARIYDWNDEYGDVGPAFPELEIQLFGDPATRAKQGIDFSKIAEIELYQEGPVRVSPIQAFADAGLHPVTLENIKLAGYKVPTPIQRFALPAIHLGHDLIAIAQTGSGKTAAYLVPILDKLMGKAKKLAARRPNPATYRPGEDPAVTAEPLVVIVCPNRELAIQIFNEARKFCYRTMLRPGVLYGGCPIVEQIIQMQKGCDVLVATPGRLIDFIGRPHILHLGRLKYMVIDEADEMLQDDWQEEFGKIMNQGGQNHTQVQFMLFSATFPKVTRDLAQKYLAEDHVRLRVGRAGSTHENIKQDIVYVLPDLKRVALYDFLKATPPSRVIIFVNYRRTAEMLDDFLFGLGVPCTSIHSERTQREREASMRAFRRGDAPVLISTAVSARGIDVNNVAHVINYDLPTMEHGGIEEYTHRIGRTGRIGHHGTATSFFTEKDEPIASVLTRTLLETKQQVPDFLQSYMPQGDALKNLKFEADSDFEGDDDVGTSAGGDGGDGDGWGGAATQTTAAADDDAGDAATAGW